MKRPRAQTRTSAEARAEAQQLDKHVSMMDRLKRRAGVGVVTYRSPFAALPLYSLVAVESSTSGPLSKRHASILVCRMQWVFKWNPIGIVAGEG
jgi:hypothetical protein